jgi:hypothetical protein
MEHRPTNPASNQLGHGVTEEQVRTAVDKSGYPLQTEMAELLRPSFSVREEWSYVDRDSKELRSMDLRAEMDLYEWNTHPKIRPHLTVLVECKQSELPYIFFESKQQMWTLEHPKVYGLHSSSINVSTDDSRSGWTFSIIHALGLHEHAFQNAPAQSNTFSKCVRKGKDLELSGTESYSGLILPMIKALDHLSVAEKPVKTAQYFDAHLSIALAVLDAPMLVAHPEGKTTKLDFAPWVRVMRHEYASNEEKFSRDRQWAVDVVHRDYVEPYLETALLPFAHEFARRVLRHTKELATGKAFVAGMEADSWGRIEERLRPK